MITWFTATSEGLSWCYFCKNRIMRRSLAKHLDYFVGSLVPYHGRKIEHILFGVNTKRWQNFNTNKVLFFWNKQCKTEWSTSWSNREEDKDETLRRNLKNLKIRPYIIKKCMCLFGYQMFPWSQKLLIILLG